MDPSIKQFFLHGDGNIYILRSDGTIWYGTHFGSCGQKCEMLQLNITYYYESSTVTATTERVEDIPW